MSTNAPHQKARILIVDDEPSICRLLEIILESEGYETRDFSNGRLALQALRQGHYDLIISDLRMPNMDGMELLKRVRLANSGIPLIICTAAGNLKTAMNLIHMGADDYIIKPFDNGQVVMAIRRALERRTLIEQNERYQSELERQVKELERLSKEKETLAEMIVHDLKNPLSVVTGRLELLQVRSDGLDERQMRHITLARRACEEILRMATDLLDVHRFESGGKDFKWVYPVPVDIGAFLTETHAEWAGVAERDDVRLVLNHSGDCPVVQADSHLLSRIMGNLISNALAHSNSKDRVSLSAEYTGGEVVVTVADTGKGIPPEWKQRIFDKYSQVEARQNGTRHTRGVGLSFCHYAVEALNGRIWVESEPGQGARFRFSLPVAVREPEHTPTEVAVAGA